MRDESKEGKGKRHFFHIHRFIFSKRTPALVVASFVTDHLYCSNAIDGGDSSASVVAPDDAAATDSPSATPKYYPAVVGPNPALYIYELEYLNPLESHMMPTVLPGKFLRYFLP